MPKLIVSPSPHIHSGDSVEKNMYGVIFALLPALLASLYFFGLGAVAVILTAIISCVVFEFFIQKFLLKVETSISDGSAVLTGLLMSFNLPSNLPLWMVVVGSVVAIGIAKMTFGGLGNNIFNPALVGRVFLLISFPSAMTTWPEPGIFPTNYMDAVTGATPLSIVKDSFYKGIPLSESLKDVPSFVNLLIGNVGGSLGEVSAIALLIGGTYLIWKKIITWHIPGSILAAVFLFSSIMHLINPEVYVGPIFTIFTGGILLGAFFMATDYVTSPMSKVGMLIYGSLIGIITMLIRFWGVYPEGVSFAILIMNAFTPIINKYVQPKLFAAKK